MQRLLVKAVVLVIMMTAVHAVGPKDECKDEDAQTDSLAALQTHVQAVPEEKKRLQTAMAQAAENEFVETCWSDRLDGKYVSEQHTRTNECYDLETAKQKCIAASDCGAIATQSNVCGGKYRVTHGGPTLKTYSNWAHYSLWAYTIDRNCLTENKANAGKLGEYWLKVSNADLYMHAWGGSAEANSIKLHGNKAYASAKPNSKFILESVGDGSFMIKVSNADLYMHAWGGSVDGNAIKLHGGRTYAMTKPNSKFILEDAGDGLYVIKVSDADLYMHAWGGSVDGKEIKLHGGRAYALSHANSKFKLDSANEAVCSAYPKETNLTGEPQAMSDLLEMLDDLQPPPNTTARALHSKTLSCLSGIFKVNPDLDSDFKKGIAAGEVGSYDIIARFADFTAAHHNRLSMAFKMLNVDGSASTTQDFIGNPVGGGDWLDGDTEVILQANAKKAGGDFADVLVFRDFLGNILNFPGKILNAGATNKMVDFTATMLQTDMVAGSNASHDPTGSETPDFYSFDVSGSAPITWGEGRGLRYWMNAPPVPMNAPALNASQVESAIANYIKENGALVISMYGQLQGCADSIEATNTPWTSPRVAKLGELQLTSLVGGEICEKLGFSPFNNHSAHRPLSSMNRVREPIYKRGQERRGATAVPSQ